MTSDFAPDVKSAPPARAGGVVRTTFSPFVLLVMAASIPLTAVSMFLAAPDARGDTLWGWGMIALPGFAAAYAVLETCWWGDRSLLIALRRCLLVPLATAVLTSATVAIVYVTPAFQASVAASMTSPPWHYWFSPKNGNPWLLTLTGGSFIGILAGLAVWVVIVLPFMAIAKPRDLTSMNAMDLDPRYARRNRIAGIAMSFALICVFGAPFCFVAGWTVAGWVFTVVGVTMMITTVLTQRVDAARRQAMGVPVGLEMPRRDDEPDAS